MPIEAAAKIAPLPAAAQIVESPFYIPMTGPASRPRRALKHDDTFVVLDSHGDIGASAGGPDGLFNADELKHGIHGGAVETSIMQARYPQLVREKEIANFTSSAIAMEQEYRWLSASRPAPFAWQAEDLNRSGAIGNATQASAEKGEALLAHGAKAFCELLEDVARFDMEALSHGPKSG